MSSDNENKEEQSPATSKEQAKTIEDGMKF